MTSSLTASTAQRCISRKQILAAKRSISTRKRVGTQEDQVWYANKPLGVNKLGGMMEGLSNLASLSKIYTNHSVRATAITLWSDAQVPSRHIIAISGSQ